MTETRRDPLCRKRRPRNAQTPAGSCACGGNCSPNCACQTNNKSLTLSPNPPGKTELAYRIGTYADFFAAMRARLSDPELSGLNELTARTTDDPAVALLDAWAGVADTLTFYQERIAGEAFLGTATERQPVADIAALVGYQMGAAAASEVYLAYELDPPNALATPIIPGAPLLSTPAIAAPVSVDTRIEPGSAVQSVPGPGESPQTFETDAPLLARADWNALIPRQTKPQILDNIIFEGGDENGRVNDETALFLKGVQTFVKPNDPMLLVRNKEKDDFPKNYHLYRVLTVEELPDAGRTRVELRRWRAEAQRPRDMEPVLPGFENLATSATSAPSAPATPLIVQGANSISAPRSFNSLGIPVSYLKARFDATPPVRPGGVYVLRTRAAVFGHNAPLRAVTDDSGKVIATAEWPLFRPERVGSEKAPRGEYDITLTLTETIRAEEIQTVAESVGAAIGAAAMTAQIQDIIAAALNLPGITQSARTAVNAAVTAEETTPTEAGGRTKMSKAQTLSVVNAALTLPNITQGQINSVNAAVSAEVTAADAATPPRPTVMSDAAASSVQNLFSNQERFFGLVRAFATSAQWTVRGEIILRELGATAPVGRGALNTTPLSDGSFPVPLSTPQPETATFNFSQTSAAVGWRLPKFTLVISLTERQVQTTVTSDIERGILQAKSDNSNGFDIVSIESSDWKPSGLPTATTASLVGDMTRTHLLTVKGKYAIRDYSEEATKISLDIPQSQIVPDRPKARRSFGVIDRSANEAVFPAPGPLFITVKEVEEKTRADYGITGKVTHLTFDRIQPPDADPAKGWVNRETELLDVARGATVLAQSDELTLAEEPDTECVGGQETQLELNDIYPQFDATRRIILAGELAFDDPQCSPLGDAEGKPDDRPLQGFPFAVTAEASLDPNVTDGRSTLILTKPVCYRFKRDTTKIYANVVQASHGETRTEILGSGEAAKASQSFVLRQKPIVFLRDDKQPKVRRTTLRVRVGSIEWTQIESLRDAGPNDPVFTAAANDDGTTTITFGDGVHGARLPSGVNNVRATFRIGGGKVGNVRVGQITTPLTRPLGVKGVINPLAASGGSDGETADFARQSAPRQAAAFGRSVSTLDYEIAALGEPEIERAHAALLSDGKRTTLYIAVLGPNGTTLTEAKRTEITTALQSGGDPRLAIQLVDGDKREIRITARIAVLPAYLYPEVEENVRRELAARFGFAARDFGQVVKPSAVAAVIQSVPGVAFADVDEVKFLFPQRVKAGSLGGAYIGYGPERDGAQALKGEIPGAVAGSGSATPSANASFGGQPLPLIVYLPEEDAAVTLSEITDYKEPGVAV